MDSLDISEGFCEPYGATIKDGGVNFCLFSRDAQKVVLNLYNSSEDLTPSRQIEFDSKKNKTGDIWHLFVKNLKPGTLYTYQVAGPFSKSRGLRFDFNQLLMDPYAHAITPVPIFKNLSPHFIPVLDEEDLRHEQNEREKNFPKCVVVDENDFDWEGDKPLNIPLSKSIIYEVHLKGFTCGKESGVSLPGTYEGFTQKIEYLKYLGVTAVELLPIFEFDETENGNVNPKNNAQLTNYWGYSTVNFFSPKASYAVDKRPGGCVHEFKNLVKQLHKAGIEVILDVVFNHTAEGNERGVTISFRGLANDIYYTLVQSHKEYYMNFSGCGNTVNCNHPVVRKFIIDCLHHWVKDYHVDGFRFDLASIMSRSQEGILLKFPPLLNAISEDPFLRNTKIIAEPWDAGGAYQLGCFPGGRWAEWNDRYRDDIRRFWRGDEYVSTGAATRISGSSDLFINSGRKPFHSINYVTCHDGFTMNDLVSYNGKHNEENGEENRDGNDSNWSYNYGWEGATANPKIETLRNRQMKNFILTLLISQGTPMLLGGDEFRRGQQGNNNAYCQDNDISWFDWNNANINRNLVTFTKRAIELRKKHAVFRRTDFFKGAADSGKSDIQWYNKNGSNPDWSKISRFLAFSLNGSSVKNDDGTFDDTFYIAANTDRIDVMLRLPTLSDGKRWYRIADTSIDSEDAILSKENAENLRAQERYVLPSSSMIILIAK